ncbi:hypothetical protein ACFOU2_05225 [Bacillus songklensis]|uniref:LysM domain-containing protein n=1 Tax=Bacillus songklensis TaxID=1069116 RepID=A0ABV8B165_9BACI
MKRLGFLMVMIFVIYVVQYDIRYGTLPHDKAVAVNTKPTKESFREKNSQSDVLYLTVKVKAGDTVLSIVEQLAQDSVPVSIEKVVKDFKTLNKGMSPQSIQIGKEYKFPLYKRT